MSVPRRTPAELERLAEAFNRKHGITPPWTDEQLEAVLREYGLPPLADYPEYDDSTRAREARRHNPVALVSPTSGLSLRQRLGWRRVNAAHVLGHIIAEHPEPRCDACRGWGIENTDGYRQMPEDGGA